MFVRQVDIDNNEADDLIAYYCQISNDEMVTIFSSDRDLTQLISDNVSIYSPKTKLTYKKGDFIRLFEAEIPHYNVKTYKILSGDKSDNIDDTPANQKLNVFMDQYVDYCSKNIHTLFPKDGDAKIADAILELFRKRESIEIFNKKALYIYIREIIDAKTPKITKIANRLYDIFKEHYYFYLENGYTNFP